jgi:hypothetical protein
VFAAGVLLAMIFPMDIEGAPKTLAGVIHDTVSPLAFLAVVTGAALISWRFRYDEKWQSLHQPAVLLSFFLAAGFVATFLSFVTHSPFLGVTQRFMLAALVTWVLLLAAKLRAKS